MVTGSTPGFTGMITWSWIVIAENRTFRVWRGAHTSYPPALTPEKPMVSGGKPIA